MATATRTQFRINRPTTKDRQRWYLWKSDRTVEEIAAREHAAIKEVQRSIDKMESYRFIGSVEEVDAEYNIAALELIQEQKEVVRRAMKAKTVRTNPVTGQDKTIDDFTTQLAAAKEAREMAGVTRAKGGPGVQVNVQQNAAGGQRVSGGLDFESRLRMLRQKREAEQIPVTITRQLAAPQEQTHAEKLYADMEEAGIEMDDDDMDELEAEVDDDEGSEESDGEDDSEDDEQVQEAPQGKVSPAQDSNPDEDW